MPRKIVEAKAYIILQEIAESINLPENWNIIDRKFSPNKNLYDYQEEALNYALRILWKYYEDLKEDKEKFYKLIEPKLGGLDLSIDLSTKQNKEVANLYQEYFAYKEKRNKKFVPFYEVMNRMSFWMATGSGKTLVIIKLIEALKKLMEKKLIPRKDILFLTYREDLIKQFLQHVNEYNEGRSLKEQIVAVSLKNYEREKGVEPFGIKVFYYRSDLITDRRAQNELNFRDYLSEVGDERFEGNWYLILDEAHKGTAGESKRKAIFDILAKNGFIFNFSATFVEDVDIVTTVYNYNLKEYVEKGQGKEIFVLQEDLKAFKEKEDFDGEAKRKGVLKSLVLLTLIKKAYKKINVEKKGLYHNPLMITLVNTVNAGRSAEEKEERKRARADLKVYFDEIRKLAEKIEEELLKSVKEELKKEFQTTMYLIGDQKKKLDRYISEIDNITKEDIWEMVFNSGRVGGKVEMIYNPKNKKEIAFKVGMNPPFLLIKVGDLPDWLKEAMEIDIKVDEEFKEESYFEDLNSPKSSINILLGSRAFYEGWDSNRPNIVNFINIGTGLDARKFVLQSVGRGLRIEPVKNKRKRIWWLYVNKEVDEEIYKKVKDYAPLLESLFITGTNKSAIEGILQELKMVTKVEGFEEVEFWENPEIKDKKLLVPVYNENTEKFIIELVEPIPFEMSGANYEGLKKYVNLCPEEVFVVAHEFEISSYKKLRENILAESDKYIYPKDEINYRTLELLLNRMKEYINMKYRELKGFEKVKDKIVHFKKIKVKESMKEKLMEIAKEIKDIKILSDEEIEEKVTRGEITIKTALKIKGEQGKLEQELKGVKLKKLAQHYYIPIAFLKDAECRVDWIKNIITFGSEVHFINALIECITEIDEMVDWWMFSKINEHYDEVYIPYYSGGRVMRFIPDFIFWIKKKKKYKIVFVDPKGKEHIEWLEKLINGYSILFRENGKYNGEPRVFKENGEELCVELFFYTPTQKPDSFKEYWLNKDEIKKIFL